MIAKFNLQRPALVALALLVACSLPKEEVKAQTSIKSYNASIEAANQRCDFDSAFSLLSTARSEHPSSGALWLSTARQAVARNDFALSTEAMLVLDALSPFSSEALAARALVTAQFGDKASARGLIPRLKLVCPKGCERDIKDIEQLIADGKISMNAQPLSGNQLDSETVRSVQASLNARGYSAGPTDGIYGRGTRNALISYLQAATGARALTCQSLKGLLQPVTAATETGPTSAKSPKAEASLGEVEIVDAAKLDVSSQTTEPAEATANSGGLLDGLTPIAPLPPIDLIER